MKKKFKQTISTVLAIILLSTTVVHADTADMLILDDEDRLVIDSGEVVSDEASGGIKSDDADDLSDSQDTSLSEAADMADGGFEEELSNTLPDTEDTGSAAGTGKKLQLGASALADNAGANGAATIYYGKNDRTWRVIGYPGGSENAVSCANCVTLLSSQVIGTSIFHSNTGAETDNDYHGSDLKTAVNNICSDTYFSTEEQNAIEKRELTVDEYKGERPYSDGVSGTPLTGAEAPKLWPLSTKEAYTLSHNGSGITNIGDHWWLRSPGLYAYGAALVTRDGDLLYGGYGVVLNEGVRPAFNINLSSIILTSAAEGGKNPGTGGAGTLTEVAAYSGTAWKLTLHDTSRDGDGKFTASAKSGATLSQTEGYSSWTVPVTYSGAQTGTNEHVSAILTNSAGTALYYGYIATNSASSTEGVDVNIPTGLSAGTYTLKVFNEQCNGDYMTDLSSAMHDIELTVIGKVAAPTFSPAAGTYTEAQNVTISCGTTGATIHYTTDGSTPTASSPTYSNAINVNGNMTIKAIAVKTGMTNSEETSATYTIHTHSYTSSVTKEPTCTLTGTRTYTCSCGANYTETIPALGHNYVGTVTKEPTLFTEGIRTYKCSRCDSSYTESIPKLEPSSEEEAKEVIQLLEDLTDEDGKLKADIDVTTETKDDGSTVTTITIGDQEVEKIITDEDGDEMIETNIWTLGGDEEYIYTGAAIKPEVHVYDGISRLSEESDYKVSYSNNKNAGDKATITVGFTGGYKGTPAIKVTFTINQADLSKYATAQDMVIAVNGRLQKPVPSITMNVSGSNLGANVLMYRYLDKDDNVIPGIKDAGTYTVQAKAKKDNGNFTGIVSATIKVEADKTKLLSNAKVKLTKNKYLYTSGPITPEKGTYTLTLNGTDLEENKDYTIELKDNVNPGKATIIFNAVEGEKGLAGSTKASFEITRGRVILPEGKESAFTYTYDKSVTYEKAGVKPKVTVMDGKAILIEGKDYVVGYKNNKAIAKDNETDKRGRDIAPKIIVTGKNNYKGSVTLPFAITGKDIDSIKGKITADDKAESKKGYKNPTITAYDDSILLRAKTDYEIDPESYKVTAPGSSETVSNPATAEVGSIITVDIIGKGNYTDRTTLSYRYVPAVSLLSKKGAARINAKAYTGKEITLTKKELNKLLYTGRGKNVKYLKYGEDFEIVRYENNLKPGTAKVIIQGINDHSGLRTLTFKINSTKKTGLKIIISKLVNK